MKPIHQIDERFFQEIDSPTKAYWLGFLVADGGVYKNHIRISLEEGDGDHVFKFRDALSAYTVPVFRRVFKNSWKTKPQLCFDVCRAIMAKDLARLGVVPNKTKFGWIPDIKQSLEPHFWRGVFDGDGHISKLSDGLWGIGLCGSKQAMEKFVQFLERETGHTASVHPIRRRGNLPPVCYRVICQGTQKPREIIRAMYGSSLCKEAPYMERKKQKADQLLGVTNR